MELYLLIILPKNQMINLNKNLISTLFNNRMKDQKNYPKIQEALKDH